MKRKIFTWLATLALWLSIPATASSHTPLPTHGTYPWNPGGTGGHHTIGVCLDTSFYQGNSWSTPDTGGRARLWEAMQTWHSIQGHQAVVQAGNGSSPYRACPNSAGRLIVYVKNPGEYPFTGANTYVKMRMEHNHNAPYGDDCAGHWPGGSNLCNVNKSIYINDYYLWYVGSGTTPGNAYDFESGLLHELGHALGLSDISGCTLDAMCVPLNAGVMRRTFGADDYAHIRYLYWDTHP